METVRIWVGRKGAGCGSDYKFLDFAGRELGFLRVCEDLWNDRGKDVSVYETDEGKLVIHLVNWSLKYGEETTATIIEFADLNEAIERGWLRVLEFAGAIPRHSRSERERQRENS